MESYTPPNSTRSYESVYFLNPGRTAEIHFPANTINNSLEPGTYYLTEKTPPEYYTGLSEDIVFTVSESGAVSVDSAGHSDFLKISGSEEENAYTIDVPNELIYSTAELTVTKTVGGTMGEKQREFRFTLTVEGADACEQYEWSKNGETQPVMLRSGASFTLKDGEKVTVTLPQHVVITLQEDNDDYTTTFRLGDEPEQRVNSMSFTLEGDQTVAVVNTKNMLIPTGLKLHSAWAAAVLLIALAGAVFLVMWRRKTGDSSMQ